MLDLIEETLNLPADGLVAVRVSERIFRRDGMLIGRELMKARDRVGSKCMFIVLAADARIEAFTDEDLARIGLQRVKEA